MAPPAMPICTRRILILRRGIPILNSHALLRLCHLVSPVLPIGAFGYSQGLERAVQDGWVHDEASALAWLQGLASHSLGSLDLPLLLRMHRAWQRGDATAAQHWTRQLIASRETAELRAEERHLGSALARVLLELEIAAAAHWRGPPEEGEPALATCFSLAAVHWQIDAPETLCGYLWAWSENQVLAAVKLIPLGQSAGQRLLHRLIGVIPGIVQRALTLEQHEIGVGVFAPLMASALHETQYSRLFRS
jgi:urease accessory protein